MPELGQWRRFFQDMIAPEVARLDERVIRLGERFEDIGKELERNRGEIKDIWQRLASFSDRVARFEGRIEGLKSEVTANVVLALMKNESTGSRQKKLPPTE